MTRHLSNHIEVVESPEVAMGAALERAAPDEAIFATGSLYLVGDLRKWWGARAPEMNSRAATSPLR
jgi:folylpolyglutamate synthase/dihydropteroate synthase